MINRLFEEKIFVLGLGIFAKTAFTFVRPKTSDFDGQKNFYDWLTKRITKVDVLKKNMTNIFKRGSKC